MDNHNYFTQPPRPEWGPVDEEIIPLCHHSNPLDEEKATSTFMMAIHYRTAISLFTVGATTIPSLTPQGSVTDNSFKPPLTAPQRLGKGGRYICKYLKPKKVWNSSTVNFDIFDTETLLTQLSDLIIGDSVADTTPVFPHFTCSCRASRRSWSTILLDEHLG